MMFEDVTGLIPEAPVCPNHTDIALILEDRPVSHGQAALWRCPEDNRLYQECDPMSPHMMASHRQPQPPIPQNPVPRPLTREQ